ncbi:MAG: DUF378 domain-containing protein [Rickettsiales bacterium]|jgi:uncharacterized membrane protein YuzA (DUF378 family)|nr:DUF378 domain-containing protein [Rickettsiales bacterium]
MMDYILKPLVLIGALNWGLVGLFRFDIVAAVFGPGTTLSRIIYTIIGIAAVVLVVLMFAPRDAREAKSK